MPGLMRIWRAIILVSPADWRLLHVDISAHVHGRRGLGFTQTPHPPPPPTPSPDVPPAACNLDGGAAPQVAFAELRGAAWALFYYNPRPRDVKLAAQGPRRRPGAQAPPPPQRIPPLPVVPAAPRFPAPLPPAISAILINRYEIQCSFRK